MRNDDQIWLDEVDVLQAVARVIEQAGEIARAPITSRERRLALILAPECRAIDRIGARHPLARIFFDELQVRLDRRTFAEVRASLVTPTRLTHLARPRPWSPSFVSR